MYAIYLRKSRADTEAEQRGEMETLARHETALVELAYQASQQPQTIGDNTAKCPRCKSTSISADKKGFGIGKAVVGAAIAGPIGLAGGNIGSKKSKNNVFELRSSMDGRQIKNRLGAGTPKAA